MLKSLSIKNYALINDITIDFYDGLSIITGETGSGKSILLGALSLLLGDRADISVIRKNEEKCIVEGLFIIKDYALQDFFVTNDIDYCDDTFIRREINTNGKSRAFINDSPVNLNVLKDLGEKLIDIHSQHQTLFLNNEDFQLQVVDAIAENSAVLSNYVTKFRKYKKDYKEYTLLKEVASKSKADLDYLNYQYNELENAKLFDGEQSELESEFEILTHSGEISNNLNTVIELLNSDNTGILSALKEVLSKLNKTAAFHKRIADIEPGVNSSYIELKELLKEIEHIADGVEVDPTRLETVKNRLDFIYNLQQKHHVNSVEELIELKSKLENKIASIGFDDERLVKLEADVKEQQLEILKLSTIISDERKRIVPKLRKQVLDTLINLGIPNAMFDIQFESLEEPALKGKDKLKFLFSANKNHGLMELSKVASGGELSRFMLAIKSLVTGKLMLPTIIFDEIDAGVSGEIADRVGNTIKMMSETMQVLNITHLPQVASKGDYHYLVYKTHGKESSETHIKLLTSDERTTEIAKMLSGQKLTDAARVNAEELLRGNNN